MADNRIGAAKKTIREIVRRIRQAGTVVCHRCRYIWNRYCKDSRKRSIRNKAKVQMNRIAVMTNTGTYTCNPKYIVEEIIRRKLPYEIAWILDDPKKGKDYPTGTRMLRLHSDECLKYVYSARIWLDNGIAFSNYFERRDDQLHIQTMHGSLGIKKLDNAVLGRNRRGREGQLVVQRESELTDYVITNSVFEENVFRGVFWKNTPMVRLGHARTDVLFSKDSEMQGLIRKRLQKEFGVPLDHKLVLYGPTHRRGLTAEDLITDYSSLTQALEQRFGGKYSVLLRLHPRTKNLFEGRSRLSHVFDVTSYPDIQELMLVSDVGITDYSSWIFDYVLTNKPGFIYASDQERYENRTGLCYPLTDTPFPVSSTFEELCEQIRAFSEEKYIQLVEAFLEKKGSVDDGHAAERIVKWIEQLAPISE